MRSDKKYYPTALVELVKLSAEDILRTSDGIGGSTFFPSNPGEWDSP